MKDTENHPGYPVNQVIFYNDLLVSDFMISAINVIDATESFRSISSESYTNSSGVTFWQKTYTDASFDIFIFNANGIQYTNSGITSNAKYWIIHSSASGTGNARLFDYSTVSVVGHRIDSQNGGQCDITL